MNDHSDIPVLTELRRELVDGVRRSGAHRTTHRRVERVAVLGTVGVVLAAAVWLFLAAGPIGTSPGPTPAAAFTVEVEGDGRIHVTMHQDFDQAERLADELREAGVDVTVIAIAAHPTLAGMVEFPSHQLADLGVERGDREFWVDPQQFRGEVEMLVYVPPEPGQEWNQAPSVFHPDEPLGGLPCTLDGPMTTEVLEQRSLSAGIDEITWMVMDPAGTVVVDGVMQSAIVRPADTRPEGDIESATRVGPHHVEATVIPPELVDLLGPTPPPSMNLNLHESPEPECTPELEARWP